MAPTRSSLPPVCECVSEWANAKPVVSKCFEWSTMSRKALYKHRTFTICHDIAKVSNEQCNAEKRSVQWHLITLTRYVAWFSWVFAQPGEPDLKLSFCLKMEHRITARNDIMMYVYYTTYVESCCKIHSYELNMMAVFPTYNRIPWTAFIVIYVCLQVRFNCS